MKADKDEFFLNDILDCCHKIETYLADIDESTFVQNTMLQDAVVRNIEIIGEASKNLSEGLRSQNPDIPWREIARMRDKVVHHYFKVDLQIVWQTAKEDIPSIKASINEIINEK